MLNGSTPKLWGKWVRRAAPLQRIICLSVTPWWTLASYAARTVSSTNFDDQHWQIYPSINITTRQYIYFTYFCFKMISCVHLQTVRVTRHSTDGATSPPPRLGGRKSSVLSTVRLNRFEDDWFFLICINNECLKKFKKDPFFFPPHSAIVLLAPQGSLAICSYLWAWIDGSTRFATLHRFLDS